MRFVSRIGLIFLMMILLAACATPSLSSTGISPAYATGTAIVAAKATVRAQMSQTQTALPTTTLTPTVVAGAPPCNAADLSGSAHAEGATGSMTFSVKITNLGNSTCNLQGPPDVQLVDQASQPLDIDYKLNCFLCFPTGNDYATPSPATQTAQVPTATAIAQNLLYGQVSLAPGRSASVFLIWNNWCQPFPEGGVQIRLSLPASGGQLTIPTDARAAGRCDVPEARSTLMVSQFALQ